MLTAKKNLSKDIKDCYSSLRQLQKTMKKSQDRELSFKY